MKPPPARREGFLTALKLLIRSANLYVGSFVEHPHYKLHL